MNGAAIEKVENFKYLVSIKTRYGDCSKDIKIPMTIAKKKMLELTEVWKSQKIDRTVKIKLLKTLIWPIITNGAEAWTCPEQSRRGSKAIEQWLYKRMLRVSWKEKRTNESILEEVEEEPGVLPQVVKNKLLHFGPTCRE